MLDQSVWGFWGGSVRRSVKPQDQTVVGFAVFVFEGPGQGDASDAVLPNVAHSEQVFGPGFSGADHHDITFSDLHGSGPETRCCISL